MAAPILNQDRLETNGITQDVRAILRELKPVVAAEIDAIVTAAYDRLFQFEEVRQIYKNTTRQNAEKLQVEHWLGVFDATFTEEQFAKALHIAKIRQQAGLDIRWYFVFFNEVQSRIVATITRTYRRKPDRLPQLISAVTRTTMYDLDIFAAVYMREAHNAASTQLNSKADEFESEVAAMVKDVAAHAAELRTTAQSMTTVASQTAGESESALGAVEDAGTNVQTVASATEELTASIGEIGRQVNQSTQIAGTAVSEANHTNRLVQGLAEAANRIGDVVKLINSIASQTNLLALNATIEAARAGDAGKGFAVVAGEVKNLASQTAKATEEIASQVAGVQNVTKEAVGAIQNIGSTIQQINETAATIAAAVDQQRAATEEISRTVQLVARSSMTATRSMGSVKSLARETGGAAQGVLNGVDSLIAKSDALAHQVARFLDGIRA
jgi:methyl-accepting chemotaxis protein